MPSMRALEEGNKRGLLSAGNKALYDEAVRRGLMHQRQVDPDPPSVLDKIAGGAETVGALASGMIAEPAAGLIGLGGAMAGGPEMGAGMTEEARKMLTYEPRTEVGRENLQSMAGSDIVQAMGRGLQSAESGLGEAGLSAQGPELAAAMHTIPTAAMEALGAGLPGAVGRLAGRAGRGQAARAQELGAEVEQLRAPSGDAGLQQAADVLMDVSSEEMAAMIRPDPDFYRAADDLGISVEPLASYASQNPQFIAIEQALRSVPASQLDDQAKKFISNLSEKADELIAEYGTTDKADMSDRFRSESTSAIDQIADRETFLYNRLEALIPPSTPVDAKNTSSFLIGKINELKGRGKSARFLKSVLDQIKTNVKHGQASGLLDASGKPFKAKKIYDKPSHEALSQARKEIGQAIYKKSGPFKNEEVGLLKQVYGNLRKDQDLVAEGLPNGKSISDASKALTIQRKRLEDNLVSLLGSDLQGSIIPKVGLQMRRLAKSDVKKWDEVMSKIEDPGMRKEVVITSLNEIFTGGMAGKGRSLSTKQFSDFMDEMNRSPAAKNRLYKELPIKAQESLDNLYKISKAVSRAEGEKIATGRLKEFFDQREGLVGRIIGGGAEGAAYAKGGIGLGRMTSKVREFLKQQTPGSKTAADLLASPDFKVMLKTAVRDGYTEGQTISKLLAKKERAFEKSRLFARWQDTLTNSQRSRLLSIGTVGYLMNSLPEGEPVD